MFEREFSSTVSKEKMVQAASSLSLTFSTEYANASKTVAECMLKNSEGKLVA